MSSGELLQCRRPVAALGSSAMNNTNKLAGSSAGTANESKVCTLHHAERARRSPNFCCVQCSVQLTERC
jgi:hypothetical protein